MKETETEGRLMFFWRILPTKNWSEQDNRVSEYREDRRTTLHSPSLLLSSCTSSVTSQGWFSISQNILFRMKWKTTWTDVAVRRNPNGLQFCVVLVTFYLLLTVQPILSFMDQLKTSSKRHWRILSKVLQNGCDFWNWKYSIINGHKNRTLDFFSIGKWPM